MNGEPLEANSVNEGEGQSCRRRLRRWTASPSSRTLSTRANVEVVIAEVEGEPIESNYVDEDEAEVVVAEVEGEPLEPNSVDEGEAEVIIEAEMTNTG